MKSLMYRISIGFCIALIAAIALQPARLIAQTEFERDLVSTLGMMTSSNLYLIYMNMSMINDNLDRKDQYPEYKKIVITLKELSSDISNKLNKLQKLQNLTDADRTLIARVKLILELLEQDAELLLIYLTTQSQDDYDKFSEIHKYAFDKIDELLNEGNDFEDSDEIEQEENED